MSQTETGRLSPRFIVFALFMHAQYSFNTDMHAFYLSCSCQNSVCLYKLAFPSTYPHPPSPYPTPSPAAMPSRYS
jgi:hypothetical protein